MTGQFQTKHVNNIDNIIKVTGFLNYQYCSSRCISNNMIFKADIKAEVRKWNDNVK
jgi:hypothetical protein